MKEFLFVTTNSLATNPRLVKELRACVAAGHSATVISFSFQNWSKPLNDELLYEFENKAKCVVLPGGREKWLPWLRSTLVSFISSFLLKFFAHSGRLLSFSLYKRSWSLYEALSKQQDEFEFVIAHNPGAFVPALLFAEKKGVRLGIDLEDFHPGETVDNVQMKKLGGLLQKVLPFAQVITAASPLILEHSMKLGPCADGMKTVINNVFSLSQQPSLKCLLPFPLKIVWFSQNIGLNRGLQDAICAIRAVSNIPLQLTLIGDCSSSVRNQLSALMTGANHTLIFLPPMKEDALIEECSKHHLGLALETGTPFNRNICLTNKLFVYLLAGNAVVASQTIAQQKFFEENAGIGKTFPVGDCGALAEVLKEFGSSPEVVIDMRRRSYQLAQQKLNWEAEAAKFRTAYHLHEAGNKTAASII